MAAAISLVPGTQTRFLPAGSSCEEWMYGSPSSWMMCTVPPSSATASSSGWSLALLQARWSARLPLVAPIASGEKSEGPGLWGHGKRGVGRGVAATGDAEGAEVAEARPWRTFYPVRSHTSSDPSLAVTP